MVVSKVWHFIEKTSESDPKKARHCVFCGNYFGKLTATTNFRNHVLTEHLDSVHEIRCCISIFEFYLI